MSQVSERKSNSPLVPIAVVAMILVAGVLWWLRRPLPAPPPAIPTPPVAPRKTPTSATILTYTLYLPNANALLSRTTVTEKNPFAKSPAWDAKAGHVLALLCVRLHDLPRTTRVLTPPQKDKNGIVTLNFSKDFMPLEKKGETTVALVLDAMASTLGAVDKPDGKPVPLKILVEGKPLSIFSEFDLSEPWKSSQPQDETAPDAESIH